MISLGFWMLKFSPILLCTSMRSKVARARERSIRLSHICGDALNSRSSKRSRVSSAFSGICIRFACENERTYVYASRSSPLFKDTLVLTIFVRIRCSRGAVYPAACSSGSVLKTCQYIGAHCIRSRLVRGFLSNTKKMRERKGEREREEETSKTRE